MLSIMYDSQTHISYHVLVIPGIILLISHTFMGVWRKLKPSRNKCVDNKLYVIFSFASFIISLCMVFAFYGLISNPNESKYWKLKHTCVDNLMMCLVLKISYVTT